MNFVQPIREINTLENMCKYLKETNDRNYILFMTGIYTGLRVSDILKFKIKDLHGKREIKIRETKTKKEKSFPINTQLRKALEEYIEDRDPDDYLIKSPWGFNKALSRQQAYNILNELGERFGVESLGTHSMRKTFGYHYYKQTKNVALLMIIFNHSHPSETLRYIGIDQDNIDKAYKSFKYF